MNKFLTNPNLPQNKVKLIICGSTDKAILNYIKSFGIEIIETVPNDTVDFRIANHTDLSVFHPGQNKILIDYTQTALYDKLNELGMNVTICGTENAKIRKYPEDCSFNCVILGNRLLGKKNSIERKILDFADNHNIKLVDVNQGYTKCSTLIVNENAFITDDESIYKKGIICGYDCIKISKGSVNLSGFDYGFIGGCGGLIDNNHLIFFGDITGHSDYDIIKTFLSKHNCRFEYLKDYPLIDIGGFVPLIEES